MIKIATLLFAAVIAVAPLCQPVAAQAPSGPPDVMGMISSVKDTADQLRAVLDALPARMDEAIKSPEAADKTLKELQDSVVGIQSLLSDNGALWTKHKELSDFTDARAKNAQDQLRATGEQRWRMQVDRWEAQRAGLRKVRDDIIKERERIGLWLENVKRDRDFILDAIVMKQVEVAVAELRKSAEGMKKMNDVMDGILSELQGLPMANVPN
jgi:hypothetical protein